MNRKYIYKSGEKMFITKDFLLKNETAKRLYHQYAAKMPIIDYHCHINPQEIYEDKKFNNITEIWLGGDHYKWRLIRSNGVSEEYVTGNADPKLKFRKFAEMLEKAIGNPMYHWTHLELSRYFGYEGILNGETADSVYKLCNEKLQNDDMSVRALIKKSNVRMIGTTDDPIDSLCWHKKLRDDKSFETLVLPSFRPDKAVNIDKDGFKEYILKLSEVSKVQIKTVEDVKRSLSKRLDFFCELGCRVADHGLDSMVYSPADDEQVDKIFKTAMSGDSVSKEQADKYKTNILLYLGKEYAARNIVMQLHYGVQRNTNKKMFSSLGPDTGFDCISTVEGSVQLTSFLNGLDMENALPKTVIYSLNPNDNELIDSVIGCFQGDEAAGKVQHGSAWWFNDTKSGMEAQLKSLANLSLLGNFIGMLTDSRSFLSYTRHEYFRRILCNIIGEWVENGEYPNDEITLGKIIEDICFNNAQKYFNI